MYIHVNAYMGSPCRAVLEREVHEAVGHVKESMEMVESAILDKDQVLSPLRDSRYIHVYS